MEGATDFDIRLSARQALWELAQDQLIEVASWEMAITLRSPVDRQTLRGLDEPHPKRSTSHT
jgi:hypothetical protein